ncbi:high affinity immunoglobulin epsilon receptor subunit beta isoform X1 [Erpetoichthys calabaricus]|uniref:high affinity immunoglobulin epsilon receptor subunit beta isoform X1 n=1 Tax=Erpetoichthys calabaricus TaxID=27687 RepID=UPI002234B645|nr:high affinity immunoglobulin epsilon receptor subunit beta isoform X1 [Erpetoichthys calabaricus]
MAEPDIEVENEEEEENTEMEHFLKRYEPACVLPRPPRAIESFLKKEPAMMGISQIVVGVISIACGATLAVSPHSLVLILRLPFITGFLFLVSGLATVVVEKKTIIFSMCLAMNCGSLVSAVIGCFLYSVDLSYWDSYTNTKDINVSSVCVIPRLMLQNYKEYYYELFQGPHDAVLDKISCSENGCRN